MEDYPYTARNLLETRESYFYSALVGPAFFTAFQAVRDAAREGLPATPLPEPDPRPLPPLMQAPLHLAPLLDALRADPQDDWLDLLVHRFEVRKRLYACYAGPRLTRPEGAGDDPVLYARAMLVLAGDAARLDRVNAMLKLGDILCSVPAAARNAAGPWVRAAFDAEAACLARITGGAPDG
ncbi:MAG: hypothetical protein ACU0CI_08770 [Shimia sp.]